MTLAATRSLKIVYCLTMLGSIAPVIFGSSGWIGLVFGGGVLHGSVLFPIVLLLLAEYRVISVIRNPAALDINANGSFARIARNFSIFLIWCGLFAIVGLFFIKPITQAVFHSAGDNGIGYFVTGIYLVILSALGIFGIVMFEFIRFLGGLSSRREIIACQAISPDKLSGRSHRPYSFSLNFIKKSPTDKSSGKPIYILTALITLALIAITQAGNLLWAAVTNNDLEKARTLIAVGANVNQKNGYGNPILHHAVSVGNAEMVELLISKGADVNLKGQFDRVALHYANKKGMAKILLAHGAIVDAPTNYGETPLHWAAEGVNGFGKQVDLIEFAETLIANGADVNKKTGEGRSYRTPLTYAVAANNLPVAKVLLAHGADVEGGDSSPLSYSGSNGDFVEMTQFLVENGAKVNQPSPSGWYPLMTAAGRGNIKVVNYLLSHGADPNAASKAGFTALYSAAGSDYGASSAKALLMHGANPNAKTIHGLTALHQAASQGAIKVMKVLIDHQADVNARDNEGYSPMYGAINLGGYRKGGIEVIEVLLKNGANVNSKNNQGYGMPLHAAINRNDLELVKLLLSSGAEIDSIALNEATRSKEMSEFIRAYQSQKLKK